MHLRWKRCRNWSQYSPDTSPLCTLCFHSTWVKRVPSTTWSTQHCVPRWEQPGQTGWRFSGETQSHGPLFPSGYSCSKVLFAVRCAVHLNSQLPVQSQRTAFQVCRSETCLPARRKKRSTCFRMQGETEKTTLKGWLAFKFRLDTFLLIDTHD